MFVDTVYQNRRRILKHKTGSGLIWLQGNHLIGINYPDNAFPFRQDSNFLYYTGITTPGLHLLIDIDEDEEYLVGNDLTIDETIWVGDLPTLEEQATNAGITKVISLEKLPEKIKAAVNSNRKIHTLPPYHGYQKEAIRTWIDDAHEPSTDLIHSIIQMRSIKEDREIREIENALGITAQLHQVVLESCTAGRTEQEIYAKAMEAVLREGGRLAYSAIVTTEGQTLHINTYDNQLKEGQLLLCDMGAENQMHYASDITRTFPVNHTFTSRQKEIYQIVLDTLNKSTASIRPGIEFKEVHFRASANITEGLKSIGLLQGDTEEIVNKGAHALFFPHGLGHMLGLDVHDMEGLGETFVGYNSETQRSETFGTANLRLGRKLEKHHTITIEPGIYFIPQLIHAWESEKKFEEHINYAKLSDWLDFGGIRIEDDVLVTTDGHRVLGPSIPKEIEEIEAYRS